MARIWARQRDPKVLSALDAVNIGVLGYAGAQTRRHFARVEVRRIENEPCAVCIGAATAARVSFALVAFGGRFGRR